MSRLTVSVKPYGPTEREVAELRARLDHRYFAGKAHPGDFRWMRLRLDGGAGRGSAEIPPPHAFVAEAYDYRVGELVEVAGTLAGGARQVRRSARQPVPTSDEFATAVAVLGEDRALGRGVRTFRPMPPLVARDLPDGRSSRIVAVGVAAADGAWARVVGVDLGAGEIVHDIGIDFPSRQDCGAPVVEGCPPSGVLTGWATITVSDGDETLWRLLAVRPAASSGTNGSGVELRHVTYRGQPVLNRAHVPILNVEYQLPSAGCGPSYRDWLHEEACYHAPGEDVAPGFRWCDRPAETTLDRGRAGGDFRGVAVWLDGDELVLASELEAAWYRYVSEWRFSADGAIRPRFGFTATTNPCTCQAHVHHAYWRLDFSVGGEAGQRVDEFNDPPLPVAGSPHRIRFEASRRRDPGRQRHWRVSGGDGSPGYRLVPGPHDGEADLYGAGDAWFVRYRPAEIDDGQGFTIVPALSRARIDTFVNAEPIDGEDDVVWYACHFGHAPGHRGAKLGPDLLPA